jgi:predicted enzyme related to lactoylglutathione lyase
MSVTTAFAAGTFSFPGYCSLDAEATRRFYCGLLGWDTDIIDMEGTAVTMFKVDGATVAAMYELPKDRKQAGVKPHWNSYIAVDKPAEVVKKAVELGAKDLGIAGSPEDEMTNLEDPTGVRITVFRAGGEGVPETRLDEMGSLCWNELCTRDAAASAKFYSELLGWNPEPFEGGNMPYTIFTMPGREKGVAGMLEITPEMTDCVSAQWLPYFQVPDAQAAVARAKELGGEGHGPINVPSVGQIVYITDNQGASAAVIQVEMPA